MHDEVAVTPERFALLVGKSMVQTRSVHCRLLSPETSCRRRTVGARLPSRCDPAHDIGLAARCLAFPCGPLRIADPPSVGPSARLTYRPMVLCPPLQALTVGPVLRILTRAGAPLRVPCLLRGGPMALGRRRRHFPASALLRRPSAASEAPAGERNDSSADPEGDARANR